MECKVENALAVSRYDQPVIFGLSVSVPNFTVHISFDFAEVAHIQSCGERDTVALGIALSNNVICGLIYRL